MFGFANTLAFAVIFKKLRKIFQGLLFPLVDLIRMNAVFNRDLRNTLFLSDRFQDDWCLLAGG